jgi:hypothetical protein
MNPGVNPAVAAQQPQRAQMLLTLVLPLALFHTCAATGGAICG